MLHGHVVLAGLGYGDEGKGAITDFLCRRGAHTVIRYNGGGNAGHNVTDAAGRHHTFTQFGSGTLAGARTHLSRFVMVEPAMLADEAAHLRQLGVPAPFELLTIDGDALLTTPYHAAAQQARERARGPGRHGSTGVGIGETAAYALTWPGHAPRVEDCLDRATLVRKLDQLASCYFGSWVQDDEGVPPVADVADAYAEFVGAVHISEPCYHKRLLADGPCVLEGAQGVLLDQDHGWHPHTTWSDTTFGNAQILLDEAGETALRLGVTRTYVTRHGPGPLVTEDPALDIPEPHSKDGEWTGPFRVGHLDAVALRYAVRAVGGVDAVAVTHLDTAGAHRELQVCTAYEMDGVRVTELPLGAARTLTQPLMRARPLYSTAGGDLTAWVEDATGAWVTIRSWGPRAADKEELVPA